jgi:hypothetical protein
MTEPINANLVLNLEDLSRLPIKVSQAIKQWRSAR